MASKHLCLDETTPHLVRAFCGWRVARRHTTTDYREVTCNLCIGKLRGPGAGTQVLKQDAETKPK